MKTGLLTISLLCLVQLFYGQQATTGFRIDSLPPQGVLLDKGWKWHAGDNPAQEIGWILVNLQNNAFYAVHQKQKTALADYKPTVTVSTKITPRPPEGGGTSPPSGGRGVEISVHDNGMGIPESVKAKIFQPFFITKPTGEGTGLGLSLSYDIVTKRHGGTLTVESSEGQGTAFCLVLPLT